MPDLTPTSLRPPPLLSRDESLLLDFDGTLVELADRPCDVVVDETLLALLERVGRWVEGRLALVSGRSIAQLDHFFGRSVRDATLIGSHGAELRCGGIMVARPGRAPALDEAQALFTRSFAGRDRVIVEEKTLGVAVHYRLEPSAEPAILAMVEDFAAARGLAVQRGKMMVELHMPGHDKGRAIAALLGRPPFVGHSPVFVGDDLTDEPGFAACAAAGGYGILVGPARATTARFALADVVAVHRWLEASGA